MTNQMMMTISCVRFPLSVGASVWVYPLHVCV